MKFILDNANCSINTASDALNQYPVLKGFKVHDETYKRKYTTVIQSESGNPMTQIIEEERVRGVIDIESLEELIKLYEALDENLIIRKNYYNREETLVLEIYDGYRE